MSCLRQVKGFQTAMGLFAFTGASNDRPNAPAVATELISCQGQRANRQAAGGRQRPFARVMNAIPFMGVEASKEEASSRTKGLVVAFQRDQHKS